MCDCNFYLLQVSTAYENQQEEFEMFKKKAFAYDEDQKRIEQLELQLDLTKKMDQKQKDQIANLKQQLSVHKNIEKDISELVNKTLGDLQKVSSSESTN